MTLREQLLEMAEPGYRNFISPLMPGVEHVIGIRIPYLRKIAKEITRGDWRTYLASAEEHYFEERMLHGLVIGYAKCDAAERLSHTGAFLPRIDNWAVCDSFCMRKLSPEERTAMWKFMQPLFISDKEYYARFAVVTTLSGFVDQEHINKVLELLAAVRHEGYYARMGVAWAVSVCFIKFPGQTLRWLEASPLADWTHNKAIQKICESYRIEAGDKTAARALKRR